MGPFAVAALRTVHGPVFVGVHGWTLTRVHLPEPLEADTDRAPIEVGRRLVVVADHSWGVIGISSSPG